MQPQPRPFSDHPPQSYHQKHHKGAGKSSDSWFSDQEQSNYLISQEYSRTMPLHVRVYFVAHALGSLRLMSEQHQICCDTMAESLGSLYFCRSRMLVGTRSSTFNPLLVLVGKTAGNFSPHILATETTLNLTMSLVA